MQKFLIVFGDPDPAREFAKRNLYEPPADDSLRNETYSIVDCHSLNTVVFDFCLLRKLQRVFDWRCALGLPLLCEW